MALVACAECGHEVSDKAAACPRCGAPARIAAEPLFSPIVPHPARAEVERQPLWTRLAAIAAVVLALGLALNLVTPAQDPDGDTDDQRALIHRIERWPAIADAAWVNSRRLRIAVVDLKTPVHALVALVCRSMQGLEFDRSVTVVVVDAMAAKVGRNVELGDGDCPRVN